MSISEPLPDDERPPVAHPAPSRRPLSQEEIAERLSRCYDLLLDAAAKDDLRRAAQREQLHVVAPPMPSAPTQPSMGAGEEGACGHEPHNAVEE
jgi:hypothetical protein